MIRKRALVEAGEVWLALAAFGIVNGAFRRSVLEWSLGPEIAHILATMTLAAAVFVAALLWIGAGARMFRVGELVWIGLLWASTTAVFELVVGRFVANRTWSELLRDYDLRVGRLFALVILSELTAPLTVGLLRRRTGRLTQVRAHS